MENNTRANRLTIDEQIKKHEDKLAELKAKKAEAEKRTNAAAEKEIMQHCRAYAAQHDLSLPDAAEKIRELLFGKQMTIEDLQAQAEPTKQAGLTEHNMPTQQQHPQKQHQQQPSKSSGSDARKSMGEDDARDIA
ncbi:MAG: hypothetical protein IJR00_02275 [Lachnospiraceae bacterium]|nr:hypothetical protein [Lachnospiraceae bacterium]